MLVRSPSLPPFFAAFSNFSCAALLGSCPLSPSCDVSLLRKARSEWFLTEFGPFFFFILLPFTPYLSQIQTFPGFAEEAGFMLDFNLFSFPSFAFFVRTSSVSGSVDSLYSFARTPLLVIAASSSSSCARAPLFSSPSLLSPCRQRYRPSRSILSCLRRSFSSPHVFC